MDKLSKAYGDLFKQIIPESPLEETLIKYKKLCEKQRRERNEH